MVPLNIMSFLFFFFQAEDGIRDLYVTGVQTCALPILAASPTQTRWSESMNILQINSSARRDASHSTRLATRVVERLRETAPESTLTVRDLNNAPHPILDEAALGALFTPANQRTPEQAARAALDDALIAELQAADVVVLGLP